MDLAVRFRFYSHIAADSSTGKNSTAEKINWPEIKLQIPK